MAWQLIYTSAPRLLEAGRTGFGTVARHRAVSGMLASTVERFSQFARLPGHDPRRVVHTYRVLTVAGASYHVFTRLKDAGSDYTGRTNHLAQHVIAEAREIRSLAASGLTPADVLLAIPWRESWTEGPRFLDPPEEIDLSNFGPSASSAWAAISGNPASARLLGTPQALKGCYLILPPDTRALELFREAMIEVPQGGWQTSFTTSLEPNDEVGDFRWIGLPFDSPLRTQAEVSNRLLLDLTQPSKLPAPPEPPAKAPLPEPERVAPVTMHSPADIRSPNKVSLGHPSAQPPPATQMGNWSPEPARTSTKKKSKSLLLAFVAVSVVSASMAGFFMWQHFTATKEHAAFQDQIKQVWGKHGLVLKNTRKSLGDEPDLEKGRALLRSLDAYVLGILQVLKNADLKGQPPTPEDTQNLPDFEGLRNAFDTWRQIHGEASASSATKASELLQSYEEWLEKRAKSWANLSDQIKKIGALPDVDQGTRAKFLNDARELLRKTQPDKRDISTWDRLNQRLGTDSEITEWLRIWSELDDGSKVQVAENAQRNGLLPKWLKTEAQKVLEARDKDLAKKEEADRKATQDKAKNANTPKPEIKDADSLEEGTHPIYVFLSGEPSEFQSLLKKTKLNVDENMQVYVGEITASDLFSTQKLAPHNAALNKWIRNTDKNSLSFYESINSPLVDSIEFSSDGYLNRLPPVDSEKELWKTQKGSIVGRIVARKESKTEQDSKEILFDLRLTKTAVVSDAPILRRSLTVRLLRTRPSELPRLVSLINRLNFGAGITVSYKLRRTSSTDELYKLELGKEAGAEYRVASPNSDAPQPLSGKPNIEKSISDLEDGIKSLKKQIDNVGKREAGREEKIAGYTKDIKAKESQIADLRSQNVSPEKPREMPAPSLPDGEYMLVALTSNGGVLDICKIQLVADKSNSAEPTPNKP